MLLFFCWFQVRSPRWFDVPFLLVSGKKMDERASYVRIIFKDNGACISHCDDSHHSSLTTDKDDHHHHHYHQHSYRLPRLHRKQIVFHIGHGSAKVPLISVSKVSFI